MDKEKVLEKIKKCLALGKSANEHEAAQALKQAQALMKKYGIDAHDIELSAIQETDGLTCAQTLPRWRAGLAGVVCAAFGVRSYTDYKFKPNTLKVAGILKFYGVSPRHELAAYAYQVLLRQLKKHRAEYIRTRLARVRTAKSKTLRADEFCVGWIIAIQQKVDVFANGAREMQLLDVWREKKGLEKAKVRAVAGKSMRDRENGWDKGREAQLHHAMDGQAFKQIGA